MKLIVVGIILFVLKQQVNVFLIVVQCHNYLIYQHLNVKIILKLNVKIVLNQKMLVCYLKNNDHEYKKKIDQ